MPARPILLACLACAICFSCLAAEDRELVRSIARAQVPLNRIIEADRAKVAVLLERAAIYCRGPVETFPCEPAIYGWLLDNPHQGFEGWKALGAKCARVERLPDGCFLGVDDQGSEVRWRQVLKEPGYCIWMAEGSGRPAPLVPAVSLRALLVLQYRAVRGVDGRTGVRHRAELFAQVDNRAIELAIRLTGMTADSVARKTIEQLELFFSGMAWYATEHPAWALKTFHLRKEDEAIARLLQDRLPRPAADRTK